MPVMAVGRPDVFDRRDKRPVSSRFARSQAVKSANRCETRYPTRAALEQTFSSRCRNSTRAPCRNGKPAKLHSRKRASPLSGHAMCRDWWSQTGSNRRPPACKAGALPIELWPRVHIRWVRHAGEWWAREDLNFRPHAYQACALTT